MGVTVTRNFGWTISYYCLGASDSVMVSKLDEQTYKSEFESHLVGCFIFMAYQPL